MNLLMVGLDLNSPWVEGIRNTTYELALELRNRGHEIHFLTKGYCYHKKIEHLKCGITVHRILTKENSGYLRGFQRFILGLPKAIFEIAKEHRIDVIHSHSSYPAFGGYTGIMSALVGSRKIFSLYSCSESTPTFEYSLLLRYALRLAKSYETLRLNNVNKIIVSSKKAFNNLISIGFSRKRIHYIPIAINTNRFRPRRFNGRKIWNELNLPTGAKVILFAGDLTPYKGVEYFLLSLKELKKSNSDVVGIILTKGLYEKEWSRRQLVEQLATQLDLRENIRLLGIRSDMEVIYNLSNVVVFPFLQSYTLMDTPRALLEAMACGRPVVTTKVGAVLEIVKHKDNGILIEPNNVTALRKAVAFLLQDEEKAQELGENAVNHILNNHELGAMTSKIEEVYGMND